MEKSPLHLKIPDLQTSDEVERAVERQERATGESLPNDPDERIDAYLSRLEKLILDPEKEQNQKSLGDINNTERPRALALLREMVLNEYVHPNKEKMAEGAAIVEERVARQMGIRAEYGEEQLEQRAEIAIGDLESSIDQWITYLSDPAEPYPMWFRYYAFRNILNLGEYDKDKREFPKRSKGTFKLFPEIDRGALAYVEEMMEASRNPEVLNRIREAQKSEFQTPEADLLNTEKVLTFTKLSFANQYAEAMSKKGYISPELRAITEGQWVKYDKGSDPKPLWASIQNKGAAWCTKGYPTAKTQLEGGDFYVYYTLDKKGEPTIPRIAIRMQGNQIGENPRGVFDAKQNLEPNMVDILEEKLKDFGPEADKYKKKSEDMKKMTAIYDRSVLVDKKTDEKTYLNPALTKDDLIFLYEVNSSIEGFGYEKDPRIAEIRSKRNQQEDLPILFDCRQDQIAFKPSDLKADTVAYIGVWNPTILKSITPNVKHIFESFPDKKVFLKEIIPDPEITSAETAIAKLEAEGHKISDYPKDMLTKVNWQEKLKSFYEVVSFSVSDLFDDKNSHTFGDIKAKAQELGLDLIPQSLAPSIRLNYPKDGEWTLMALKESIRARDGDLRIFHCGRNGSESWLRYDGGRGDNGWARSRRFFFVRK